MVDMRGLFGNLNNTLNNLPLSGNLGLLTTGVGLLEGQPIGQAVRSGLQTFQGLQSIDEERKRKELVQDLVSKGGFTEREKALIAATPIRDQPALIQQINARKAAASKPNAFQQRQIIGAEQGLTGEALRTFVLTGELPKTPTQTKIEPLTMISEEDVTIGNRVIPANTPFNVLGTDQESFKSATDQGAYTIAKPQQIMQTTIPSQNIVENVENVISQTESKVSDDQFDIGTAAGGDIVGGLTDLGNALLGFTLGVPLSAERSRQSAFINNANNQIKVPMVRALAPRGAKYARDEIDKIIPQPTDSNPKFVAKLREILPDIEITINEVAKELTAEESEKGFGTALGLRGQLENLLKYKVSAEQALQNYDASNIKTETQKKADKILEGLD